MTEEYLDIVDENNHPTGQIVSRQEAHERGLWHRTVHICFFRRHDEGIEFLVHLRAQTKDRHPNQWDTRFGGHIKSGETVEQVVRAEIQQEVGLEINPADLIAGECCKHDSEHNKEFNHSFFYEFSGDASQLRFSDGEVQAVKWMSITDIEASMESEPERWAGSLAGFKRACAFLRAVLIE